MFFYARPRLHHWSVIWFAEFVRSVVAFWFATPRTPPLWQHGFFLVNGSVLRSLLASERSGVVKTFRCATYAELNANPYESPESTGAADGSVAQRTPVRATIAACMAPIALAGFLIHDPWQTRDGVWLMTLAEALPWFLASIFLPVYALMVRNRSRLATWIAAGSLLILAVLPQTWGYVRPLFTQLIPIF